MFQQHPDEDVQQAIIRLNDALCSWERATGRQNLLVVIEQGGYEFVADCGKPLNHRDLHQTPEEFVKIHREHYSSLPG